MTDVVRVAVVGVGSMGANHARVLDGLKGAHLVAVVDRDLERAQASAERYGCRALDDPAELPDLVDAATIAVPSAMHAPIACPLLAAGVHCLVEKPMAGTRDEAVALIEAAREGNAHLAVGHIERFNPAITQLREILADGDDVVALEAHRMSAVSGRVVDIDVVSDLMVHDLDIVLDLVRQPVVDVVARGALVDGQEGRDYVTAVLTFASGALAVLTASRVTQNQVRSLQVTTTRRLFTVDYSNQELLIYRQGRIGALGAEPVDGSRYVLDVGTERVFVRRQEPLVAELSHFLDVAAGRAAPVVTGEQALTAMELVWTVADEVRGGAR